MALMRSLGCHPLRNLLLCNHPALHLQRCCISSSSRLFVGGLSWSVDEKSLMDAFSSFGEVTEVRIMYDRDSGRPRGFGFVYFSNEKDAVSAKDAMDGKALLGRPLRISFAIEKVRGGPLVVPRLSSMAENMDERAQEGSSLMNPSSSPPNNNSFVASPEFEFWMVRNPAFPQPQIHSADELFVDGMILPLHLLNHQSEPDPVLEQNPESEPEPEQEQNPEEAEPSTSSKADSPAISASKRWTDIFKLGDKKLEKEGEKKKDRKNSSGSTTELNINIWPFSRSWSAGNAGGRPRAAGVAGRKACSAPCSRSNSGGESKTRLRVDTDEKSSVRGRKWPNSPGRGAGVYLGKSSPVRPIRRHGGSAGKCTDGKVRDKVPVTKEGKGRRNNGGGGGGGGVRVLNVNVPLCIGYRHNLSCNSDDNSKSSDGSGSNANGSAFFNLRTFFSKKVY